jgi:hypothetical protein
LTFIGKTHFSSTLEKSRGCTAFPGVLLFVFDGLVFSPGNAQVSGDEQRALFLLAVHKERSVIFGFVDELVREES